MRLHRGYIWRDNHFVQSPPRWFLLVFVLSFSHALVAMPPILVSAPTLKNGSVEFTVSSSEELRHTTRLFVAVAFSPAVPGAIGSAVLPFGEKAEGSTVFLPFQAQQLLAFGSAEAAGRVWADWKWQPFAPIKNVTRMLGEKDSTISIPLPVGVAVKTMSLSIYRKTLQSDDGWGELVCANDALVLPGKGDKTLSSYDEIDVSGEKPAIAHVSRLHRSTGESRPMIYQLFVRHFSNANPNRKTNGTLAENGVGKFNGIDDAALDELQKMGFTHLWLTGVLQQATGSDYSAAGAPADDPDLLKGIAGSPYAIKDYYDVSPDYADEPGKRLEEFKALLERIHAHGMKAVIDFVPNHVARSYGSDVRSEMDFGKADDKTQFFAPGNNFFYLGEAEKNAPLKLPTQPGEGRDGLFDGEKDFGRVTGNNVASWAPSLNDWYETVKLNYGFDFVAGTRIFPSATMPGAAAPDTWKKMDAILAYWQEMGVDGFRCDMAHMIPPEFWKWEINEARSRSPEVFFMAEAYNNDPAKVPAADPFMAGLGNVMIDLLDAGFDAVYDDPSYKTLKGMYDGNQWGNDLKFPEEFLFQNSVRYAENHDEVRLGSKGNWAEVGATVGPAVSAVLFGVSRGPVMIYNGQELGEKGAGVEGFGGEDGRSSIFDYWSLPGLVARQTGALNEEQKSLRARYGKLLEVVGKPPFTTGRLVMLNESNKKNADYGRLDGETDSGHWLVAFLRNDPVSQAAVVMAVNLNPTQAMKGVKVRIPGRDKLVEMGEIPAGEWVVKDL